MCALMKKFLLLLLSSVCLSVLSAVPFLWERAEDLSGVKVTTTGTYSVLAGNAVAVEGQGAFYLAHPTAGNQIIQLDASLTVPTGVFLFFESRLGWATSDQVAYVEVSTDGTAWTELWSRQGTGDSGQNTFERVALDLSAFAGATLNIRFRYAFQSGNFFNQTQLNPLVGWLMDDIQVGSSFFVEPVLYTIGEPTDLEQLNLEYINRARASAVAEALRLRDTDDADVVNALQFFAVDTQLMLQQFATLTETAQPLAFNERLLQAARLHSQDMLNNAFQSHTSSAQPVPPNQPGDSMVDRLTRQGYQFWTAGENVYSYARSMWHAHAGFNIDWGQTVSGGSIGGMQDPPGHRESIHNPLFREVGIGVIAGSNGNVGPYVVTQNFGTETVRNQPFLTGVVFRDVNGNNFYDPGEGIGGVLVSVAGERFAARTSASGGYAIPLSGNGTFEVTFTYLEGQHQTHTFVVTNDQNVKIDFDPQTLSRAQPVLRIAVGPPGELHIHLEEGSGHTVLQTSTDLELWQDVVTATPVVTDNGDLRYTVPYSGSGAVFFRAITP